MGWENDPFYNWLIAAVLALTASLVTFVVNFLGAIL